MAFDGALTNTDTAFRIVATGRPVHGLMADLSGKALEAKRAADDAERMAAYRQRNAELHATLEPGQSAAAAMVARIWKGR
jgi:hypothetical protein